MRCKANCRGFTLAELLIVVAIIAILVAIAAPLFVGALDDAKEAVKQANIRAVRGAAIAGILSNPKEYLLGEDEDCWIVLADAYEDGSLDRLTIIPGDSKNLDVYAYFFPTNGKFDPYYEWLDMSSQDKESYYQVAMLLFPTEVSAPSSPSDP